jgi:hypothetical protein
MSKIEVDKVSPRTGNYVSLNTVGMKNIIINGDMSLAQRSTSVASISTTGYYTVDRIRTNISSLGTWTQSQSTDVPTGQGFANSLKLDCTTANASPSASAYLYIDQRIEGQNLQYLKKGTANAESTTLSFWVKSNKTGTYIAELIDTTNDRNNVQAYIINLADTWEKKTLTYSGDTTGTLTNDNLTQMRLDFWLGAGSDYTSGTLQSGWETRTNANRLVGQVNLADDTANEWFVTGVQLEAGTTASDFEFLPVDVNLGRCLRYFQKLDSFYCMAFSTTQVQTFRALTPIMRASPSIGVTGAMVITDVFAVTKTQSSADIGATGGTSKNIQVNMANFPSLTSQRMYFSTTAGSEVITVDAEL